MEQLAQSPWSLQTASKSSPFLCQTWALLCSSTVAAPNRAALFSACHWNQPASAWNTCSLLKFPAGISDFFGYMAWIILKAPAFLFSFPFFCLSIFCQPSAEVNSLLSLFQATLLEGLYCIFAWSHFPVWLPLHRGILPVHLSWSNFSIKYTQEWHECLLSVSNGCPHGMGLFLFCLTRFLEENAHTWSRIGPSLSQN